MAALCPLPLQGHQHRTIYNAGWDDQERVEGAGGCPHEAAGPPASKPAGGNPPRKPLLRMRCTCLPSAACTSYLLTVISHICITVIQTTHLRPFLSGGRAHQVAHPLHRAYRIWPQARPTSHNSRPRTGHPSSYSSVLLGYWTTIKLALHGLFSDKLSSGSAICSTIYIHMMMHIGLVEHTKAST